MIYCFNLAVPPAIQQFATEMGVEIRHYNVIYHLVDNLREELTSRLPPVSKDEILGRFSMHF